MTTQPYYQHAGITLYQADCLTVMQELEPQSVDAIIADIPYGTTACSWDQVIPFVDMWRNIKRLIKPRGAVILFGSEPFSSHLRLSNIEWYKYDWVWNKKNSSGYLNAKKQPMRQHEIISVFGDGLAGYYPIMRKGVARFKGGMKKTSEVWGQHESTISYNDDYYPTSIIEISNANRSEKIHPTQKPVELMQYLVKTHSKPGDLVLDFTAGSGTTLEAARNEQRRAIGIERDLDDKGNILGYCEYTVQRLAQQSLFSLPDEAYSASANG
jgi:site-specific DNA-methyltransferase (adenine-specific)